MLRALLVCVFLVFSFAPATSIADDCSRDCNNECPKRLFGARDPVCKASCEAAKAVCKGTGVSVVPVIKPLQIVEKALNASCALGYEAFTKTVGANCGFSAAAGDQFEDARADLISAGVLPASEFDGVRIQYCSIITADGLTPDRDTIFINEKFRDASAFDRAVILAHEMKHVQQIRSNSSTDSFKCNYTKEFIKCLGCQDHSNSFEDEAYQFGDGAAKKLTAFYAENESEYVANNERSFLGTYGVAAAAGCSGARGPASIYFTSEYVLRARNECGAETAIQVNDRGRLVALDWGNLEGTPNFALSAVFWSNDTQWVRVGGKFAFVGDYPTVTGGGCSGANRSPAVGFNRDGKLVAVNECGNVTPIVLKIDGSVIATGWNNIRGNLSANALSWSNGTVWSR